MLESTMVKLFIDDERSPIVLDDSFIVRSYNDAIDYLIRYGCPDYISFDHDLGSTESTGYDIAKWIVERDISLRGAFIPKGFRFAVHSANIVGGANIENYLSGYLAWKEEGKEE